MRSRSRPALTLAIVLGAAALVGRPLTAQPGARAGARAGAEPAGPRLVRPVLAFPDPGLDDTARYQGYRTRIFRDAAGNTLQVYVEGRAGRVVHLWADADNASAAFSAQDARGRPVSVEWAGDGATVARGGRTRTLVHPLVAQAAEVRLGHFLLGTMRVERDFQYERRHEAPLAAPFVAREFAALPAALARLPEAERRRHLALLGAADVPTLTARLRPTVGPVVRDGAGSRATVVQPSLDGRDTLTLAVQVDARAGQLAVDGDALVLRAAAGTRVPFTVTVGSTARALTPLARAEIFAPAFLEFLAAARRAGEAPGAPDSVVERARRLERQVRGVELLSSREKLMAGLPTYATYFGRDMLVTVLMMREIWRPEMSEFAIAAALRKLAPDGQVSHEEALGAQADREAAAEYAGLVEAHLAAAGRAERRAADSLLARARTVLADHRRPRENYHMVDDELQLAVLAGRWLSDPAVPRARKAAFLAEREGGRSRGARLLGALRYVAARTAPYAAEPVPANLVAFAPRDTGWGSASWRDSGAGYGGGKYAMDVNAIWAPHALEALGQAVARLRELGYVPPAPPGGASDPLARYVRDPGALAAAVRTWQGAGRHFVVTLPGAEARARVAARLAALPEAERALWTARLEAGGPAPDSLSFLDVALDAAGRPLGVANTDPATALFLGASEGGPAPAADAAVGTPAAVRRDLQLFAREYPAGLLVPGVGPAVANDAWATPAVWQWFARDPYHGPKVVWGREVNLFLLGAAAQARAAAADPARAAEAQLAREAIARVHAAVRASGFHAELWSYEVQGGRVVPVRYGTSGDVQLWSTTDLAVEYALARLAGGP